jgi:hypothetical protein
MFLICVIQASVSCATASSDLLSATTGWLNAVKTLLEVIGIIGAGVIVIFFPNLYLWYSRRKKLLEKQDAAYQDYYPKLKASLTKLRDYLRKEGQLETKDPSKGNIFALRYEENYRKEKCPEYQVPILSDNSELKEAVQDINIMLKSDMNVHPRKSEATEWQRQMAILESFCDFILNLDQKDTTNPDSPTHTVEATVLNKAFNYILSKI